MDYFVQLKDDITKIAQSLYESLPTEAFEPVTVELPRDSSHGDLATNCAMVLAKKLGQSPKPLAEALLRHIMELPYVKSAEMAGPGFINVSITLEAWTVWLSYALSQEKLLRQPLQGEAINVEYVSANPTGPMHAGHGRVAVVGDVIANMAEAAGATVTREYYINDGGAQAETLGRSAHLRYLEACGHTIDFIPEGYYPGDYLKAVGEAVKQQYGDALIYGIEEEWLAKVRPIAINAMMDLIRNDLAQIDIKHHVFTSENWLVDEGVLEEVVAKLKEKGLAYRGVLEKPLGLDFDDWQEEEQLLFKSTEFGDDIDRVLQKANGEWTYFAKDIAYHYHKYKRGFKHQINVWGADHKGYVKRLEGAVKALSNNEVTLKVILCNLVHFKENGVPIKMSKRAGTFITLQEVIDAVGKDILRFVMVTRKNVSALDFDFEKVKEQSKDNPVFYVQYAHARICSVFRNTKELHPDWVLDTETLLQQLTSDALDEADVDLIKKLAQWPKTFDAALSTNDPQRIAQYMYDVAAAFHNLWNQGKENTALRFISDDRATTSSRLALIMGVKKVLAEGLRIFGVQPAEEM